jgi:glucosamine 6-phosphate synthetase-like amidotransferase/phosphosugar isomerase protein
MIGLAIRLARHRGINSGEWEASLVQIPLLATTILGDRQLRAVLEGVLSPYVAAGYDKIQIIGGGQDHAAAASIACSLRSLGFLAEALYTDSAWHGPLATVGGPDADHDTLIVILATDPLFQAAALVDTQVYRTRNAAVILLVPEGNQDLQAVHAVDASAVVAVPAVPRAFLPLTNAIVGSILAEQFAHLWEEKNND